MLRTNVYWPFLLSVLVLGVAEHPLNAQAIPKEDYLSYVPLSYPRLVRQTEASAAFNLYGDTARPDYRDVAPVDGIDDRRGRVLHELSVRFAPYLVRNTVAFPMDFRRFMEGRSAFLLNVHTWDIASAKSELIGGQTIDLLRLPASPCHAPTLRTSLTNGLQVDTAGLRSLGGIEDCALLRLLDEFDPDHPLNARFGQAAVAKGQDPFKVMYYDFPGDNPTAWKQIYQNAYTGNVRREHTTYHMVYAHPFIHAVASELAGVLGYEVIIQYWFFYPFNDGGNNHLGDWEHINVAVAPRNEVDQLLTDGDVRRILSGSAAADSANPLVIKRVEFYFHHKLVVLDYSDPNVYLPRAEWEQVVNSRGEERLGEKKFASDVRRLAYKDDAETVINTHPIGYIGADNKGLDQLIAKPGGANRDSHGTYPFTGLYKGVGPAGATEQIGQHFDHRKYFADTMAGLPEMVEAYNAADRVELIPDWERVLQLVHEDVDARRMWSWIVLPVRWGYPAVQSPFAGVISHAPTGNLAPFGPTYQSSWNQTGPSAGFDLYEPHRFTSVFTLGVEDNLQNKLGYLNVIAVPFLVLPPFDFAWRLVLAPVRIAVSRQDPAFYPSDQIPFRFAGPSGGASLQILPDEFSLLSVNSNQTDEWVTRMLAAGLDTAAIALVTEFDDVETGVGATVRFSIYTGRRLVTENLVRHTRSEVTTTFLGVIGTEPALFRIISDLTMWEYAGSLRYNLATEDFQPFLRLGYGLSWYRLEDTHTQVNDEAPVPLDNDESPWVRRPFAKFSNLLPNTFHFAAGLEWIPLKSFEKLPWGMDVGLRADYALYNHELGFNDIRSPIVNPPPGETFEQRVWRSVFEFALTVSF